MRDPRYRKVRMKLTYPSWTGKFAVSGSASYEMDDFCHFFLPPFCRARNFVKGLCKAMVH
jgi:hypothetical protein